MDCPNTSVILKSTSAILKGVLAMQQGQDYYEGKVGIVTGGASGIGVALAETMLLYGASRVVLVDINESDLRREANRLNQHRADRALGICCDVTREHDVSAMISRAHEACGKIDILISNAGAGFSGAFDTLADENWKKAFDLNFYGALFSIRAVLPIMRRQGGGHIVSIISGIAFMPMAYQTMYSATKAALNGLTLALRYELWDENIRVTSATPGTTATAIWKAGGRAAPAGAQSPEQSAKTILAGVARNERLVLGDMGDLSGAKTCFNPDFADGVDNYLREMARRRRNGQAAV